jgi:hypothetical protein
MSRSLHLFALLLAAGSVAYPSAHSRQPGRQPLSDGVGRSALLKGMKCGSSGLRAAGA